MKRTVLALLVLMATSAWAQEFSARFTVTGDDPVDGKIYVSGVRVRMEIIQSGEVFVALLELTKNSTWTQLNVSDRTYSTSSLEHDDLEAEMTLRWLLDREKGFCDSPELRSCKFVGLRTVHGRTCDQYESQHKDDVIHQTCFDQELHFPIQDISPTDGTTELFDVALGKQPNWLFVVPKTFKKAPAGYRRSAPQRPTPKH